MRSGPLATVAVISSTFSSIMAGYTAHEGKSRLHGNQIIGDYSSGCRGMRLRTSCIYISHSDCTTSSNSCLN
jgi:hypothetical protein